MNKPTEDILTLSQEVKEISDEIANMKRKKRLMPDGEEKEELREDIKIKQYQALFYIEMIENLLKTIKK